ncbi:Adhesion G-Protein Coupled Receptor F3 [Manis pentadactyla]|nr:Adhesion G-Protein Coupled Receptor F3 [Manis pentadactyla]
MAVDSPSDLLVLLGTMTLVAKVVVNARVQLNYRAMEALLRTTDKVLDMDSSSLWTPVQAQRPSVGSDLLLALETLARSLCPQDHPFSFSLSNVQLQTQLLGPTFPADYRVSFSTQPPLEGVFILFFGCLMDKKVQEALLKRLCHTQPPNSTISLVQRKDDLTDRNSDVPNGGKGQKLVCFLLKFRKR